MALDEVKQRNVHHKVHKTGWLRAAVLGANDGLIATSSLIMGAAAAKGGGAILTTVGAAGIAAGALSMAVGEYVSVSSQVDIEESDRQLEIEHLRIDPEGELDELTEIYVERGLKPELAREVAIQMTEFDALETHLRDELGQFEHTKANPLQASVASAISFVSGGIIPMLGVWLPIAGSKVTGIILFTLVGLVVTGILSATSAGSNLVKTTLRICIGGIAGMAVTAGIGSLFHVNLH